MNQMVVCEHLPEWHFCFIFVFSSDSLLPFPGDEESEDYDEKLSEGDEQAGKEGRIRQTRIRLET